jgi:hypothetical protein
MKIRYWSHRRLPAAAVVVIALFAFSGVALGTIPGSNGVISGCYIKDGFSGAGKVRVIDAQAGKTCNSTENQLSWNKQGPQGPQGPAGVSGYHVESRLVDVPANEQRFFDVWCTNGTAIGGGVKIETGTQSDLRVLGTAPNGAAAWRVAVFNPGWLSGLTVRGYAVCANVS